MGCRKVRKNLDGTSEHQHLAVAPGPGSFLSVVRSGERPRWQHPRALKGQGQTAIRGRPIG